MKKSVKVNYPMVTTYTHHAHLLAALSCCEEAAGWIYSNYIQIYMYKDLEQSSWGDFYFPMPYEQKCYESCKWLRIQKNDINYINSKYPDIIEYIKESIDQNYCVNMTINYYHISRSHYYNRLKRIHDLMVYGYDDAKQVIYCADFMFDAKKYTFQECSYYEFRRAFKDQDMIIDHILNGYIYAYKINYDSDYKYNVDNIWYWIDQYIQGTMPEYWKGFNADNSNQITWGLNCYDTLCKNYSNTLMTSIDIRLLYLLTDHKNMMIHRLIFMQKSITDIKFDEYIDSYQRLYKVLYKVVNLAVKFNISKERKIVDRIQDILYQARSLESESLKSLLNQMRNIS